MLPISTPARRLFRSRPISNLIREQIRFKNLQRNSFAVQHRFRQPPSFPSSRRCNSSLSVPGASPPAPETRDEPSYELSFTCKPCLYRSSHRVTKQGYHHGTVLVTCPSCKSRHVISDHLKIFLDSKSTLEDILRNKLEKGQDLTKLLKKGSLGIRPGQMVGNEGEEDLEFWEDGTETVHTPIEEKTSSQAPSGQN